MTAVRGAAANAALGAPEWCGHHARLRRPAGEGLRRLLAVVALAACAAGALLAALQNTAGRGGRRHAVALEGPWTPESEVVMKPGLTFNEMNQLHGQVQQARWASRFGDNVPKQVSAAARACALPCVPRVPAAAGDAQRTCCCPRACPVLQSTVDHPAACPRV
jgi:hypothetical protein